MKIWITGAAGMVGKNIMEHMTASSHMLLHPSIDELNLLNYQDVRHYLKSEKPDFVVHCAGRVGGIEANMSHPVSFLVDNWDIGRNVFLAAKEEGVTQGINLASSCIYPRDRQQALSEDLILKGELEPTNEGYALAKISVLRLCEYLHRQFPDFNYKTLIPCNLYGRWDKFDPLHSHMIPGVMRRIHQAQKENKKTVEIWGDGTARREFMYAGDLADFIWYAIENFAKIPTLMNVGLGFDYTIKEYYQAIAEVVNYQGQFTLLPDKPVGMMRKLVSIEEQNKLGWQPQTSLQMGLKKSYQFFLEEWGV